MLVAMCVGDGAVVGECKVTCWVVDLDVEGVCVGCE